MTPEQHTPALQRRNLGLLVAAQSLGGASPPIIISLGGLVGQQLSTNPTATTLPVSIYQLGLALSTLPAAWLMQRMGRRTAYVLGAILGVALAVHVLIPLMGLRLAVTVAALALRGSSGRSASCGSSSSSPSSSSSARAVIENWCARIAAT